MKKTIIQEQLPAYLKASLPKKTAIVSSVCHVSGMHRKAAIRAFAREQKRSSWKSLPKLGRPKHYTAETEAALAFVWDSTTTQVPNGCTRRFLKPSGSSSGMICGTTASKLLNNCGT